MHHYVIVGGGTAGSVLAGCLSADPKVRVLLLEAGASESTAGPVTIPQQHLFGRTLCWKADDSPAAPMALHSPPAAYEAWADAGGWGYAAVRPYRRRLEGHGTSGPFSIADGPAPHPLTQAFVRAAANAGLPYEADLGQVPRGGGVGLHQLLQRGGQPCSAATAYLQAARHRPNLTIITSDRVCHIDMRGRRATGVSYVEEGFQWSAEAERAVILCAGAAGSPLLLMRSGIGPAGLLADRGVEVVSDLPGVGRGLQVPLEVEVQGTAEGPPWPRHGLPEAAALAHVGTRLAGPHLHLQFGPAGPGAVPPGLPERVPFTVRCALLRPRSRGRLVLHPDDPADTPVLDPGGLSDPEGLDLAVLVAGLRRVRRVLRQQPFLRFNPMEVHPGFHKTTDAALRAYVRLQAEAAGVPAGTCRMGTGGQAVVNTDLRVRGLDGLRVADASVMPAAVRGHSALPLVVLAERAADLLRGRVLPSSRPRRAATGA